MIAAVTPEAKAREAGFFDGLYERAKNLPPIAAAWYVKGYLRGRLVRTSFTKGDDDEARTR